MREAAQRTPANETGQPIRVCFFFNAQRHQLLHGIATAAALARRSGFEVHVLSPSPEHVEYAEHAIDRLGGAPIVFSVAAPMLAYAIRRMTGAAVPPKVLSLSLLARHLDRFDAIAVPERTSLVLKRIGAPSPRYIHLDHGAGDRAAGFDPRIANFDMALMAGRKHHERLLRVELIRSGDYAIVGYPKFEAADAVRDPEWSPFDGTRPIVLYNPHFTRLGSWNEFGLPLLRAFAAQDRYDLIVAPHVRMLDGRRKRRQWAAATEEFARNPHIHLDPGSDRSIDMTYTTLADIYVGDVSSQVYEFLRTPRPCLFLDPHAIAWEADENYAHWRFGPVVRSTLGLVAAVDEARATHSAFADIQRRGFDLTFEASDVPASERAATAIATHLDEARQGQATLPRAVPAWKRMQRVAAIVLALGMGWLAHDIAGPLATPANASDFIDDAVMSHRATLIRADMVSQPEVTDYDRMELEKATGVTMPGLPADWKVLDVQVYPSDSGPSVQVSAETTKGERFSVFGMKADTPGGTKPSLDRRQADSVAYWEEGDLAFAIVGSMDAKRLLQLAAELDPDDAS